MRSTTPLALACLAIIQICLPASASTIAGMGDLTGSVTADADITGARVFAHNKSRNVRYMVYVTDGQYHAVNVFPGDYEVSIDHLGFAATPQQVTVASTKTTRANFKLLPATITPDYAGGMVYPDAAIEPYDVIYPPGRGRDVLERTCMGCHTVQLFPYNVVRTYPTGRAPKDRDAWAITVDRMHQGEAFMVPGKESYFDTALLPPADRDALVDYLATHFPADAPPRVVRKDFRDPALDPKALATAMFVEYIFPNTAEMPARFTQQIDFDRQGNVWVADRGAPGLVKVDPRTGVRTDYVGHGGGHGIALDRDGTVWYSGDVVRHFDPATDKHDAYVIADDPRHGSNTQVFDSKGNLWLSLLSSGALGMWDRETDTVRYWDVPISRSRPYGIIVDHDDKVWFAGYHNSGVDRFDPVTQEFKHFKLTDEEPTNIRRPGVDSNNNIWAATWGSAGMVNGALYRLDPKTAKVERYPIPIPYTNPYSTDVDEFDLVWLAADNFLLKFDPVTKVFTYYPLPTRTDIPKMTIAAGGAIWYTPRNAGQSGTYGGGASVLYPDMNRVRTFAASFATGSAANRLALYRGKPGPAVRGVIKVSPKGFQNSSNPPAPKAPLVSGPSKREGTDARKLE